MKVSYLETISRILLLVHQVAFQLVVAMYPQLPDSQCALDLADVEFDMVFDYLSFQLLQMYKDVAIIHLHLLQLYYKYAYNNLYFY